MKTLIAYGTKYGCAEKCARLLAERLDGEVDLVDLKKDDVPDISTYDRVIIGGSVYAGQIRKEVKNFCAKRQEELKDKALGLFFCGMLGGAAAEAQMKTSFPEELLNRAVAKGIFGGEIQTDKLSMFEKMVVNMVAKSKAEVSYLSEEKIDQFADAMKKGV